MCVCDSFLLFIICNSVYIFTFNCYTYIYSCTFGMGLVGRGCLYFGVLVSFAVFSLRQLTCMHCVSGAVITQGFVWKCFFSLLGGSLFQFFT